MRRMLTALALTSALAGLARADEYANFTRPKVTCPWQAFRLDETRLKPGSYFHAMMLHERDFVLSLDIDRLVCHLRKKAGLPVTAKPYGGWEQHCNLAFAHYLSSLSLYSAATGDKVFLERLDRLLAELTDIVRASPKAVYTTDFTKPVEQLKSGRLALGKPDDARQPWGFNEIGHIWYGVHKVLAGLRDAYVYAGRSAALEIAKQLLAPIVEMTQCANRDLMQAMLALETGGMVEVLADFYAITGDPALLEAAVRFNQISVIYPTAEGEDVLHARHANDQIPRFVGAAREHLFSGRDVSRRAAVNFWDEVVANHTLANGGNGCYERFGRPGEETKRLDVTCAETCNTYNMIKLSRALFLQRGETKYLDYLEWAQINHILASIDPCHLGFVTYYTAMRPGDHKRYSTPYDSFWCCVDTAMESHAKYGENVFFNNGRDLLVALFTPTTLDWREKNARFELAGDFPASDTVTLKVLKRGTFDGRILVRRPAWAKDASCSAPCRTDGDFLVLDDVKEGETVHFTLPRRLHVRRTPDDPHFGSLCFGPVLLAAELDAPAEAQDPLVGDLGNLDAWIRPAATALTFTVSSKAAKPRLFKPYYSSHHHALSAYWKLYSPAEYAACRKAFTDRVQPGVEADERAHGLTSTNSQTKLSRMCSNCQRPAPCRYANGGEFSYVLKIDPAERRPYRLIATYWGDEVKDRQFEVLAEGRRIATVAVDRPVCYTFVDSTYEIPPELTSGKSSVRVTFRSQPGKVAGALFDLKITADPQYF